MMATMHAARFHMDNVSTLCVDERNSCIDSSIERRV